MRFLKTSEAAALLNVSPNTLRAWERRFGYPKPQRSPGKHRLYTHGEVAALRDALQEGLSISSAVSRAREGLSADTDTLVGALASFDRDRADSAMEAALAWYRARGERQPIGPTKVPTLFIWGDADDTVGRIFVATVTRKDDLTKLGNSLFQASRQGRSVRFIRIGRGTGKLQGLLDAEQAGTEAGGNREVVVGQPLVGQAEGVGAQGRRCF